MDRKQKIKMCGGGARKKIKYVGGGGFAKKNKIYGRRRPGFFPVRPPLRISNGIALAVMQMTPPIRLSTLPQNPRRGAPIDQWQYAHAGMAWVPF